jgi:hypothetical protein
MFSFRGTGESTPRWESDMAKEAESVNHGNPAQPFIAAGRAVLNEVDQQTDRWLEYGIAQVGEGAKLAHAARAQATQAARAMLDTVEKMAQGAAQTVASWTRS